MTSLEGGIRGYSGAPLWAKILIQRLDDEKLYPF
jgi:hypothetical protein